jgi:hypothetical protein
MKTKQFDFTDLNVEVLATRYQVDINGGGLCDWMNEAVSWGKNVVGERFVNAVGDAGNYVLDHTPLGNTKIGTGAKAVRSAYRSCHRC